MDPLSVAASVAGLTSLALEVSRLLLDYYSTVKNARKEIEELRHEFATLELVTCQLKAFLESEKAQGLSFQQTASVLCSAVEVCKAKTASIVIRLKEPKGKIVQRALERLTWPFKKDDLLAMLDMLRRYNHLFQFSLSIEGCALLSQTSGDVSEVLALQMESSQKLYEMTKMYSALSVSAKEHLRVSEQNADILELVKSFPTALTEITEISRGVRALERSTLDERDTRILNWLSSTRFSTKHIDIRRRRVLGTGNWLLEHPTFQVWMEGLEVENTLWCVGGPGVGKTTLTSMVVDHLHGRFTSRDVGVAYFYCDYQDQYGTTQSNITASLLRQFAAQAMDMPTPLVELYERNKVDSSLPSVSEMSSVLRTICSNFKRSFVLLDAFDEISKPADGRSMLQILKGLRSCRTNVYVTSRTPNQLRDIFSKELPIVAQKEDIRSFLLQTLDEDDVVSELLDDDLRNETLHVISERAHGMFLLPVLQIQTILEQVTKSGIRKALQGLEGDLNKVYESSFQRIKSQSTARQDIATRSLMWIAHARRPLHADELRHALAIQVGVFEHDEDSLPSLKVVIESCSGLVTVDKVSSTIRLVHYTLQSYIKDQRNDSIVREESTIANSCLTYLLFEFDFASYTEANDVLSALLAKYPFLIYASEHWGHHAREASSEDVGSLAARFLLDKDKLSRSLWARDSVSPWFDRKSNLLRGICRPQDQSFLNIRKVGDDEKAPSRDESALNLQPELPSLDKLLTRRYRQGQKFASKTWDACGLHSAASFGLTNLVTQILGEGIHVDTQDDHGNTALHEAAAYGQKDTAEILLSRGAYPNALNYERSTPLFLAAWVNNLDMIQLLLDYGAVADVSCKDGWTALHKAADAGHLESMRLLLQRGAFVLSRTLRNLTPLHRAAGRGSVETVQLLLQYSSEIDAITWDGWTPLHGACSRGQDKVAALLLKRGAKVNFQSHDGRTPLHRAARAGYVRTVLLLLEHGADPLISDSHGTIALHRAAKGGHESILKLLLQHSSHQLHLVNASGNTAHDEALYGGFPETARLLRQIEESWQGKPAEERTELQIAIDSRDCNLVAKLIRESVDIELPNAEGLRPLHQALLINAIPVASLLLQRGANVKAATTTKAYQNALHIAARKGSVEGVKLCLAHRASVDSRNGQEQTALHEACSSGDVETVLELLEAEADIEADDYQFWKPIHKATSSGHEEIVRVLLEHGAELKVETIDRYSVQACAARNGHYALVEFIRQMR